MDQWLANIYGTGGGEDLEKTAQAVMLQKLAEEEGVDISGLDEAQLEALAQEVLGDDGDVVQDGGIDPQQQQQIEGGQPVVTEEQLAKEAQAKFEEADFLGRVMAHAYTQELEKIAASQEQEKTAAFHAGGTPRSLGNRMRFGALKAKMKGRAALEDAGKKIRSGAGRAAEHVKKHKGTYAAGAAGAAGAYAAGRAGKNKEASAFEKLAFEHAQQILGAAEQSAAQQDAIRQQAMQQRQVPQQSRFAAQPQQPQMQPQQPQMQQQQSPQFQQALDERALQILAENGYDVDAIVGQLEGADGGGDGQPLEGDGQQ